MFWRSRIGTRGAVRRRWETFAASAVFGAVAVLFSFGVLFSLASAAVPNRKRPPQPVQSSTPTPIYLDTHYPFAERAADLVSRMTLAEKVAQLHTNSAPAIPRLGVQQYTYWSEGQHGINTLGADTNHGSVSGGPARHQLPDELRRHMSWDPELIYQETHRDLRRGARLPGQVAVGRRRRTTSARTQNDYGIADLLGADGEPGPRPAVGTHRRGVRRGPVPGRADGRRVRRRLPGRDRSAGQPIDAVPQGRGHRQALRAERRREQPARRAARTPPTPTSATTTRRSSRA